LQLLLVAETALRRAGDPSVVRGEIIRWVAVLHGFKGNLDKASDELAGLVRLYEKDAPESYDLAGALLELALLQTRQGKFSDAISNARRALAIDEKVVGLEHPSTAIARGILADTLHSKGEYLAAETELRTAIATDEKFGRGDDLSHGYKRLSLGNSLFQQRKEDGARVEWERALAIFEAKKNQQHVGSVLNNLAVLARKRGDFEQALAMLERSLAIEVELLGAEHANIAVRRLGIARVHLKRGNPDLAAAEYTKAKAMFEKTLGPKHVHVANALMGLSEVAEHRGRIDEATRLTEQAVAIRKASQDGHPDHVQSQIRLAELYRQQRRWADAAPLCVAASDPKQSPALRVDGYTCVAATALGQNRAAAALEAAEAAIKLGEDSKLTTLEATNFVLARALWRANKDRARAMSLARAVNSSYVKSKDEAAAKRVAAWIANPD
jgi:tetratricopeptide (TPR) repeat protein